jgi:hypothetical protein
MLSGMQKCQKRGERERGDRKYFTQSILNRAGLEKTPGQRNRVPNDGFRIRSRSHKHAGTEESRADRVHKRHQQ